MMPDCSLPIYICLYHSHDPFHARLHHEYNIIQPIQHVQVLIVEDLSTFRHQKRDSQADVKHKAQHGWKKVPSAGRGQLLG